MLYGSLCSIHGYPTSVVVCFIYIIRTIEILHILPVLLHSLSASLTLIDYKSPHSSIHIQQYPLISINIH